MIAKVKGPTREQFSDQQWQAFGKLVDTVERIVRRHQESKVARA